MTDFKFEDVAHKFNSYLVGQLPWYPYFIQDFFPEFARYFIKPESIVYDLGASTGNVEKNIESILEERKADFRPIEYNEEMIKHYQGKFKVIKRKIEKSYFDEFSFCSSILCLSFIHPADRLHVINILKRRVILGGAILVLEKFQNTEGIIGTLFNRVTWRNKLNSHQPLTDIIMKELDLSGVQYPLLVSELEDFDLVWAYGDFKAYIHIKK